MTQQVVIDGPSVADYEAAVELNKALKKNKEREKKAAATALAKVAKKYAAAEDEIISAATPGARRLLNIGGSFELIEVLPVDDTDDEIPVTLDTGCHEAGPGCHSAGDDAAAVH